jgi:hypothetical protein
MCGGSGPECMIGYWLETAEAEAEADLRARIGVARIAIESSPTWGTCYRLLPPLISDVAESPRGRCRDWLEEALSQARDLPGAPMADSEFPRRRAIYV